MKKNLEELELRSDAMHEVLTRPPRWIIRYGISIVFLIIIGTVILSWFIKYPDIISAKAIVTSQSPPERLEARASGRIAKLFVANSQKVKRGELLGILESSANYEDVLKLKKELENIGGDDDFKFPFDELKHTQLGDIQSPFIQFSRAYTENELNEKLHPIAEDISASEISQKENLGRLEGLYQQQKIEATKLRIAELQFKRAQELFDKGVISKLDYEKEKASSLQAQQTYDQTNMSISQQRDAINQTRKQIVGSKITQEKTDVTNRSSLQQSLDELKKAIRIWEQTYVFRASYNGKFLFQNAWKENGLIRSGELFATILPDDQQQFVGNLTVAAQNSGKVRSGQKVLVRLDNFPYQEYGVLEGTVETMSIVPDKEGGYFTQISLPDGLHTSYGKQIKFDKELSGNASIITDDLRLIQRIFYQFKGMSSGGSSVAPSK
ncbi:HlyD family secretion protein [Flavobacterium silvaticum]|uniref:HlyD family efflux transporter periplasmic adaptor subunit n=1 Tax=Flavobacterium silvaticum TaxID=1852020 RepID=A0A972FLN2_9FLAO|nr:HlyD family efflux transporter periplasmic adaptor subunit [Flavobacterium silvaticum]NMH28008.1 HlyD family efflux transporter periplasmic adaptor subunit [Flavobacterium silvaticum]